jgi:hypothetical protein
MPPAVSMQVTEHIWQVLRNMIAPSLDTILERINARGRDVMKRDEAVRSEIQMWQ